jgi:mono/diheme cytochrome c family protein
MSKYPLKTILVVLALTGLLLPEALAFHKDIYQPRVPEEILQDLQDMDSPYETTPERIEAGRQIYFGKGLCVTCHSNDGRGVRIPGHSSRDFTNKKWQDIRTDGELMWVLKNGSPGTGMPVRVGRVITEEEGWYVIQFIRTFVNQGESKPSIQSSLKLN